MELLAFSHVAIAYDAPHTTGVVEPQTPHSGSRMAWLGLMGAIATLTVWNAGLAPALALQVGDAGLRVEQLQTALQGRNYYSGNINGFYGTRTETAVIAFQRDNSLPETGIADSETLQRLGVETGTLQAVTRPSQATRPTTLPATTRPAVAVSPVYAPVYYQPNVTLVGGARTSGIVQTQSGLGINVRNAPGGQIIGGEPDGAIISYIPGSATTTAGYTWVQTSNGGWVAQDYLRSTFTNTAYPTFSTRPNPTYTNTAYNGTTAYAVRPTYVTQTYY